MSTFRTKDQRDWEISVNYDTIKLILDKTKDIKTKVDGKEVAGIDLGDDGASGLLALTNRGDLVVRVITYLVEKQLKVAGVTPEDFGRLFDGDTIEAAEIALRDAQEGFTRPSRKSYLRGLLAASDRDQKAAQEAALEGITDQETAKRIREAFKLRISKEIAQGLERVTSVTDSLEKSESSSAVTA